MSSIVLLKRAAGVVALDSNGCIGVVTGVASAHTSPSEGDVWVLPKGHIEDPEWWYEAALREAFEELGVRGVLNHQTAYTYVMPDSPLKGDRYVITFYVLHVTEKAAPSEALGRKAQWLKPEDAIQLLTFREQQEVVNQMMREGDLVP